MIDIERIYASLIREYLGFFPAVAIIGPRQCGKTTLLKVVSSGWTYYDLELGADFDYIKSDPDLFFQLNTERIAIDEAQLIPELFSSMRVAIDADREKSWHIAPPLHARQVFFAICVWLNRDRFV